MSWSIGVSLLRISISCVYVISMKTCVYVYMYPHNHKLTLQTKR